MDAVVQYAIDQGLKIAFEAFEKWRDDFLNNPSIVVPKAKAEKYAGGRMVLENLRERGSISPYQFGIEVVTDEEGNIITKPKGYIYYKRCEIMKAIENGNILKCLQKRK